MTIKKSCKFTGFILLIFILSGVIADSLYAINKSLLTSIFAMIITYLLSIYLWMSFSRNKISFKSLFTVLHIEVPRDRKMWKITIGYVFTSIVLIMIVGYLLSLLKIGNLSTSTTNLLLKSSGIIAIVNKYLYPIIIGPIFEEIIFRGISAHVFNIFDTSNTKTNLVVWMILSSLLFGLLHLQVSSNLLFVFAYCLGPIINGIFFSLIYYKTKNLSYSILSHSFYNLFILLINLI